jgi:hypothetical protein
MKQLLPLFLFLLPCLAWAQYPSNGNQKITLGEQTTADGLIYRGVLADTGIINPSSDTSAYIILDTVNHRFYNYNRTTNVWSMAGGGTAVTTFSGGSTGLTPNTATSGAVTLGGTLAVANGGTNVSSLTSSGILYASSSSQVATNSNLTFNGSTAFSIQNIRISKGANNQETSMAIGFKSLDSTGTGAEQNMAIGYESGLSITTASYNNAYGYQTLRQNKTGSFNNAFGYRSSFITTGERNSSLGAQSLYENTSGSYNTAIGFEAGYYNTTGEQNVFIGYRAGWASPKGNSNTTGSNNIIIGSQAVGASATASNVITLGNSSIATIRAQVTTITSLSDIRDKTNIMPLNYGIDFIKKLNPVSFDWDMRDGGKIGISEIGFIAQELQQAQIDSQINIPNLVSDINPDKLEASYGVLIPIMVKALKEQQALIDELKQRILNLENK